MRAPGAAACGRGVRSPPGRAARRPRRRPAARWNGPYAQRPVGRRHGRGSGDALVSGACEARLVASRGGFEQLGRGPHRDEQLRRVLARVAGGGQRLVIAPETVQQHGPRPVRVLHRRALAAGSALLDGRVDHLGGLVGPAPMACEHEGAVGRNARAGRLGDRVGLRHQRGRPPELTAEHRRLRRHVRAHRAAPPAPRPHEPARRCDSRRRRRCRSPTPSRRPPSPASPSGAPPRSRRPRPRSRWQRRPEGEPRHGGRR